MKQIFLTLFLFADAATGGAVAAVAEFTSELLTKLKAEKKLLWAELIKHEDPDTKEALEAKMNVWKKDGEIKSEIQRLELEAAKQKLDEQRNLRLGMNKAQFDAYDKLLAAKAVKNAKPEDIAAAQTAFDTAKELVDNELLAKYAKSSLAKAGTDGTKAGKPATSENKYKILDLYRAGKKHSEIIAETGIPDSTVWHTINNAIVKDGEPKLH